MQTYKVEVYDNGDKYWFNENGQYHREDGPAIVYTDGCVEYWLNGVEYTEEKFNAKMNSAVNFEKREKNIMEILHLFKADIITEKATINTLKQIMKEIYNKGID